MTVQAFVVVSNTACVMKLLLLRGNTENRTNLCKCTLSGSRKLTVSGPRSRQSESRPSERSGKGGINESSVGKRQKKGRNIGEVKTDGCRAILNRVQRGVLIRLEQRDRGHMLLFSVRTCVQTQVLLQNA